MQLTPTSPETTPYNRNFDLSDAALMISWLPGDFEEAESFVELGKYEIALNLIAATIRDIEAVLNLYPQFESQVKPYITQATQLTQRIIALNTNSLKAVR